MRRNLLPYTANRNKITVNQQSISNHINNMRAAMNAPIRIQPTRFAVETNINIETDSDDDYLDDYFYNGNS